MSTTRAQITKRQRRMRRAAERRLQKQHKAHLRELRAAAAAHQARQRAIAAWNAEEDRLQRLRETEQSSPNQPKHNAQTRHRKLRAVKFAEQVLVTEIPLRDTDKLPKPVTSPIGVSICGTDDDSDTDTDSDSSNERNSPSITFSQLPEGAFPDDDDDDDPEFTPDDPPALRLATRPTKRPRRRIVAKRLNVPLEQIIPAKPSNKSAPAHAPKRPRRETQQSSTPSDSTAPSSPIPPQGDLSNLQANSKPTETATEQKKQSKQRYSSNDVSPSVRLKNKRKRLHSADNVDPNENKRKTTNFISESRNKNGCTPARLIESATDQQRKLTKTKNVTRHHRETRALRHNTDRTFLTSSGANVVESGTSSERNGQEPNALKIREGSSTSMANGHSKQNGHNFHGLRDDKLAAGKQDKASGSDDDNELDTMFGDLVKQKAANRAKKEKKLLQEKRAREETSGEQPDAQRNKKKFKKDTARYTKDGLRIMTFEEIAADQPPGLNGDCPFDCSCCF